MSVTESIIVGSKKIGSELSKNSPTILTGMAIGGLLGTVILAVRATPKACLLLEEASKDEPLKLVDIFKATWKEYLPAGLLGAATITFIVGANSIHLRRSAALAGVYSITKEAFDQYKYKVIETIGEKKEAEVHEEIAKDVVNSNPVSTAVVYSTGDGDSLFFDPLSGRYFRSDVEKIRQIENTLNHRLLSEMWVSLNEFYSDIGLKGIDLGHDIGWSVDSLIDIVYTTQLTDNNKPCIVLNYQVEPEYSGSNFG